MRNVGWIVLAATGAAIAARALTRITFKPSDST
jgi:hypothetical protein